MFVFGIAAIGLAWFTAVVVAFSGWSSGAEMRRTVVFLVFGWIYVITSMACFWSRLSAPVLLMIAFFLHALCGAMMAPSGMASRDGVLNLWPFYILPVLWVVLIVRADKRG